MRAVLFCLMFNLSAQASHAKPDNASPLANSIVAQTLDEPEMGKGTDWKFSDGPNTAAITTKNIMYSGGWISFVSHDEDGTWQFHGEETVDLDDALVVGLTSIVKLDPSVQELSQLPLGYYAWRDSKGSAWRIAKAEE